MKCFSFISSKRRTPWDGKKFLSPYEKFIKDQYLGVYSSRHPILSSTGETKFLNSFQVFHCRYCGSENFIRYGHTSNGINRISVKTVGELLPLLRERSLKITKFPAQNGWNRFFRSSAMRAAVLLQRTAEIPLLQQNTGMPRYLTSCKHTKRISFFRGVS